jgi:putative PEP-CTERM system histidine kinase
MRCGERPVVTDSEPLVRFLTERRWVVEMSEWRAHPERYGDLVLPQWLTSDPDAWLVVPLLLQERLVGFAVLQRPVAPLTPDWEVRDVLRAAGMQIAGYLAVRQAVEGLVQARQFDSFNRMSAFVVHDLKNLVAQLTLLLKNAARHRDNPEFQRDMLETVENVLDRMQGLLMQLRAGTRPIEPPGPVRLDDTLRGALASKRGLRPEPLLEIAESAANVEIVAHRDRLERVVGHLVQNAVEATPAEGSVRVVARREDGHAVVQVVDTGRGIRVDQGARHGDRGVREPRVREGSGRVTRRRERRGTGHHLHPSAPGAGPAEPPGSGSLA